MQKFLPSSLMSKKTNWNLVVKKLDLRIRFKVICSRNRPKILKGGAPFRWIIDHDRNLYIAPCGIHFIKFKSSLDPGNFIDEITVGKSRIRHITTLNLNFKSVFSRSRNSSFNFRVVVCRIRLFPTLISKIKWLRSGLPLSVCANRLAQSNASPRDPRTE